MKTKVKFLVHSSLVYGDEIFAFFPDEPEDKEYTPDLYTSYAHIGQHSACHIDYANESREATLKEYLTLKEELISLGYKLDILNKAL